jgi:hypothetical protein
VKVTLTWAECEQAAQAGIKRRLLALHDSRPGEYGFRESDPWGVDIESAAAELAVARTLCLWWTPWARRPRDVPADVGKDVQVRRRAQTDWDLILHEADRDEHTFVLVVGTIPQFDLVGWISGLEGKSPAFWGDPYSTRRPAFWVPQDQLRPIEELLA